jgi:hypothetical protein
MKAVGAWGMPLGRDLEMTDLELPRFPASILQ